MKKIVFLALALAGAAALQAQQGSLNTGRVSARIAQLMFSQQSALWFTNADTGAALTGARVDFKELGQAVTDADGLAIFDTPADGTYSFSVSKDGFMAVDDSFRVALGSIIFNKYSVPPIAPLGYIKIVLDWGKDPADLDIHVIKDGQYHISYHDMKKSADGTAWLDRDETKGYGPETVTITQTDNNAVYHIYVHDYTNRNQKNGNKLAAAKAVVSIYNNNRLQDRFPVTQGKIGVKWSVFDIKNGKVETVNKYE
ncbi:hypothetical protein AGMMS49928_02680 [Spirochaetia bacterium]|nr:hypothetical protein AGMMS49928_02680 [Spirochaetia bacterium]